MDWRFGDYLLDGDRFELTCGGARVHVEPQVLAMLLHLARNRDRLVPKDELAEAVWKGQAVSDASLSSRVRSARAAVGDDGRRQAVIRTVHGLGFRFVAEVEAPVPARAAPAPGTAAGPPAGGRPSIAILPLQALSVDPAFAILAEAIPHDLIQAMSRLRWIAVTARGSSFHFRRPEADPCQAGAALGVRYVLSGTVETPLRGLRIALELTDCTSGEIIWSEGFATSLDGIDELRGHIVARLTAALETYVPLNEARTAELNGAARLDAWASYHLGLRHLYRFTAADTAEAERHFAHAVDLDPVFARAHAGLSFTSFITAFLRIAPDPGAAALAARRHAERAVELDPLDPFTNFTMGRAHWLTHDLDASAEWLARATALNPNYAQGYYASAFTAMILGRDGAEVEEGVCKALKLSPLDPLLYGMLGVRALALMQRGDYAPAADWAEKAARAPRSHYLIGMIAVAAQGLAGETAGAAQWRQEVRRLRPAASSADFFQAFPIRHEGARAAIGGELRRHGF